MLKIKNELILKILPLWRRAFIPIMLALIGALLGLILPQFPRLIIDGVISKKNYHTLIIILCLFIFFALMNVIVSHLVNITFYRFQKANILHIQRELIKKLLYTDFQFFLNNHSGYLAQKIRTDVESLANVLSSTILFGIISIFQCLGSVIILIKMNIYLAFIALLPFPFILKKIIKDKNILGEISGTVMEVTSKTNAVLTESFSTFEIIKSNGKEANIENKIVNSLKELTDIQVQMEKKESIFRNYIDGAIRIGEILAWGTGAYFVIKKQITIGELTSFVAYLVLIHDPMRALNMFLLAIAYGKKSLQRVQGIFDLIPENGNVKINKINSLRTQNLTFWYEENNLVFYDINISLLKGQCLLIKGCSGTGKTTLIRTLLGLLTPKSGNIYWNEQEIDILDKKELRNRIGFVSQDLYLFQGSLIENLTLGEKYDLELIKDILIKCKLPYLIDHLFNEKNDFVKEHGLNFSGGERQRLALARILIKKPDVIILDEATVHLDSETKNDINKLITDHFSDRMIIKISHENETSERDWQVLELCSNNIENRVNVFHTKNNN